MNKMKIFTLFLTCIVLFVSLFSCQQAPPNGDGSDTTESNGEATLPDDSASDTEGTVEGGCQGLPRYFDLCWDAPMEGLLNFLSISYEVQQVEFMNIPLLCTWVQEIRQKNSVILPYVNGELIEPEGADITTEYGEFVTNRFSFKKNGKEFILKIQYTPQGYDPAQLFEGQDYRRITLADRVVHAYSPPHNHKIIQFMYDDLWVYMHMDTLELDTEWFATLSFEETPLLEEVPSTTVETKDGDAAIYPGAYLMDWSDFKSPVYASYVDGNADVIEIDVEGDQSLYIYYRNGHFQNVVERFEWGEKGTAETRMLKVN